MAIKTYLGQTEINKVYFGNSQVNNSIFKTHPLFDGLIMWLDADDASTISTSTQGGETRVSAWLDKSGNNNHATAPYTYVAGDSNTTLFGPKYTSSFAPMNNRGVMDFDLGIQGGASSNRGGMSYTNNIFNRVDGDEMTMFIAFYTPTYTLGNGTLDMSPAFFSEGSGSGDAGWEGIEFKPYKSGYGRLEYQHLWLGKGGSFDTYMATTSGSQTNWTGSEAYIMGFTTNDINTAGSGSTSTELFINTNNGTTKEAPTITFPATTTTRLLGFNPADIAFPKNGLAGDVGEILVYNRYMDSTERQEIYNYLSQKWGI